MKIENLRVIRVSSSTLEAEVYGSTTLPVQFLIPNNTQSQNLRFTTVICGGRYALCNWKPEGANDTMVIATGTKREISSGLGYLLRCMEPKHHNHAIQGGWQAEMCIVIPASIKNVLLRDSTGMLVTIAKLTSTSIDIWHPGTDYTQYLVAIIGSVQNTLLAISLIYKDMQEFFNEHMGSRGVSNYPTSTFGIQDALRKDSR